MSCQVSHHCNFLHLCLIVSPPVLYRSCGSPSLCARSSCPLCQPSSGSSCFGFGSYWPSTLYFDVFLSFWRSWIYLCLDWADRLCTSLCFQLNVTLSPWDNWAHDIWRENVNGEKYNCKNGPLFDWVRSDIFYNRSRRNITDPRCWNVVEIMSIDISTLKDQLTKNKDVKMLTTLPNKNNPVIKTNPSSTCNVLCFWNY